jgi:hypothetical protein
MRVTGGAKHAIECLGARRELGRVRFAEQDSTGPTDTCHDIVVAFWHMVGEDGAAIGRAYVLGIEQVLGAVGLPGQRAEPPGIRRPP